MLLRNTASQQTQSYEQNPVRRKLLLVKATGRRPLQSRSRCQSSARAGLRVPVAWAAVQAFNTAAVSTETGEQGHCFLSFHFLLL